MKSTLAFLICLGAAHGSPAEEALIAAQRAGALAEALAASNRALEAGAHPLRVHLVRGDAYLRAEEYADAAREYFEVVSAAPHNGFAHVHLWLALRAAHLPPSMDGARLRGALRQAGYFIADAPRRPRRPQAAAALEAEGEAHLRAGRFKAAVESFEAAVTEDDTRPAPFRGLGIAYGRLDDARRSVAAYRLYLRLGEGDTRERRAIERIIYSAVRRRALAR